MQDVKWLQKRMSEEVSREGMMPGVMSEVLDERDSLLALKTEGGSHQQSQASRTENDSQLIASKETDLSPTTPQTGFCQQPEGSESLGTNSSPVLPERTSTLLKP